MPATAFQAFILCGPGESLSPFNSNPKDLPKALIPIANRPMLWYPLEWCYKTGITNIKLIAPQETVSALESHLSINPYLTSLPHPRPTILSPEDLTLTTGTAEIFRLPEVQDAIVGEFVVLPCDLVCELPGTSLMEAYMTLQSGLGNPLAAQNTYNAGRGGGLGVWYETKDGGEGGPAVKKEATDFLATTEYNPLYPGPKTQPLFSRIAQVAITMPTDTLTDTLEDEKALKLRRQLVMTKGNVRLLMTKRDAHLYLLPYWMKNFIKRNDFFESLGEDVLGWWAKATWQKGLREKLHVRESLQGPRRKSHGAYDVQSVNVDIASLSSTSFAGFDSKAMDLVGFAARVQDAGSKQSTAESSVPPPPLLSYVHPALEFPSAAAPGNASSGKKAPERKPGEPVPYSSIPLIRRVDTTALLLSTSLYLAKLPAAGQPDASAFLSHPAKVHATSPLPTQATIDQKTVLIDANCTLAPRITIRECVIGANVKIASGSRLTRCLIMPDTVIEEKCILSGCVIGRRCNIGKDTELRDCQVQEGYAIPEKTSSKSETFAGFEEGDALMEGDFDPDEEMDFS